MKNCCLHNQKPAQFPGVHRCPVNGKTYKQVNSKALMHHISTPWSRDLQSQGFYFCTDPDCKIVYFGEDDEMIVVSEIRTNPWQKNQHSDATLCHCFGITYEQAEKDPKLKAYVIRQTKNALCSCETSNPSGRCCLKDFPVLKALQEENVD